MDYITPRHRHVTSHQSIMAQFCGVHQKLLETYFTFWKVCIFDSLSGCAKFIKNCKKIHSKTLPLPFWIKILRALRNLPPAMWHVFFLLPLCKNHCGVIIGTNVSLFPLSINFYLILLRVNKKMWLSLYIHFPC